MVHKITNVLTINNLFVVVDDSKESVHHGELSFYIGYNVQFFLVMSNIGRYVSKEASCIGSLIGTKNTDRTSRYRIGNFRICTNSPKFHLKKKKDKKTKMKNHEDWAQKNIL